MRYSDCKTLTQLDAERARRSKRKGKRRTPHCYAALEAEAYTNAWARIHGVVLDDDNPQTDALGHVDPSYDFDRDEQEILRHRVGFLSGADDGTAAYYGDCRDDGRYGFSRDVKITTCELAVSVERTEQAIPAKQWREKIVTKRKNRRNFAETYCEVVREWFPDWHAPLTVNPPVPAAEPTPPIGELSRKPMPDDGLDYDARAEYNRAHRAAAALDRLASINARRTIALPATGEDDFPAVGCARQLRPGVTMLRPAADHALLVCG